MMWRLACLAILAGYCLARSGETDIQQLFREALELQRKGDLEGAVARYRQLLAIRNNVPPAHANLGAALAALGRYPEAISSYEEALKNGENPATRLNLALAYYKSGDFVHAAQEFNTVRNEQPGSVQASTLVADCYLRLGDNRRVIGITIPLAAARPDDLAVQYLLGTALIRDHQTEQGRQIINLILTHGESAGGNLLQAQLALADQDYSKANALTEAAIRQAPELADAYVLNGAAKEGLGDYAGSRSAFEHALKLDPAAFDANLHLSGLMLRDSETASAERYAVAALRLRPSSAAALYQMGLVHRAIGEFQNAVADFEAAEKQSPKWLEPHVQLATLYYRLRRSADGQRERELVTRLSAAKAEQPEEDTSVVRRP